MGSPQRPCSLSLDSQAGRSDDERQMPAFPPTHPPEHLKMPPFELHRTTRIWVVATIVFFHGVVGLAVPNQVLQGDTKIDRGVRVPAGKTKPGNGRRMVVHDEWADKSVVGRALLTGSSGSILELPSGRLQFARTADLQATDRPFEPTDKRELGELLVDKFFQRFKIKTSKHYVYVYNSSDNFQMGTQAILESMLDGVVANFKKLGFDVHEPKVPLIVLMFRTEAEYRKHFDPTTGWLAFYNHNVNFIAMFEYANKPDELRASARKRAITTIAHEGAHQLMTNIGVQQRLARWPIWTTEGIADYFAPTDIGRALKWAGAGKVHEGRLNDLINFVETVQNRRVDGSILRKLITSAQLDGQGYAKAWGLTYFLTHERHEKYLAYLREVSQIEPNRGVRRDAMEPIAENLTVFTKHFGEDLAKLERDWFEYTIAIHKKYEAQRVYYVTFMQTHAGRQVQRKTGISPSADAAREWQLEQVRGLSPILRRTTRVETKPVRGRLNAEATAKAWLER